MNRIDALFQRKKNNILSIFLTGGYPTLEATESLCLALDKAGVDCIEIGIPFSDPVADGPLIQETSAVALKNGATIENILRAVGTIRKQCDIPLILMGYFNPVLQYGVKRFLQDAREVGVDGVILPDLPPAEFKREYQSFFTECGIHNILLISPNLSDNRIQELDALSNGCLYGVSSLAVTGGDVSQTEHTSGYLKRLQMLKLRNPVLIGFGIRTKEDFSNVCRYTQGAIIGSAFLKAIKNGDPVRAAEQFVGSIR